MLWLKERVQKLHVILWPEARMRLCRRRQVVFPLQARAADGHHWPMELFNW